jgi:hypothetical protein
LRTDLKSQYLYNRDLEELDDPVGENGNHESFQRFMGSVNCPVLGKAPLDM